MDELRAENDKLRRRVAELETAMATIMMVSSRFGQQDPGTSPQNGLSAHEEAGVAGDSTRAAHVGSELPMIFAADIFASGPHDHKFEASHNAAFAALAKQASTVESSAVQEPSAVPEVCFSPDSSQSRAVAIATHNLKQPAPTTSLELPILGSRYAAEMMAEYSIKNGAADMALSSGGGALASLSSGAGHATGAPSLPASIPRQYQATRSPSRVRVRASDIVVTEDARQLAIEASAAAALVVPRPQPRPLVADASHGSAGASGSDDTGPREQSREQDGAWCIAAQGASGRPAILTRGHASKSALGAAGRLLGGNGNGNGNGSGSGGRDGMDLGLGVGLGLVARREVGVDDSGSGGGGGGGGSTGDGTRGLSGAGYQRGGIPSSSSSSCEGEGVLDLTSGASSRVVGGQEIGRIGSIGKVSNDAKAALSTAASDTGTDSNTEVVDGVTTWADRSPGAAIASRLLERAYDEGLIDKKSS